MNSGDSGFSEADAAEIGMPEDREFQGFLHDVASGELMSSNTPENHPKNDGAKNKWAANVYTTLDHFVTISDLSTVLRKPTMQSVQKKATNVLFFVNEITKLCMLDEATVTKASDMVINTAAYSATQAYHFCSALTGAARSWSMGEMLTLKQRMPEIILFLLCSPRIKHALAQDEPGIVIKVIGKMASLMLRSGADYTSAEGIGKLMAEKIAMGGTNEIKGLAEKVCTGWVQGFASTIHSLQLYEYEDKKKFANKLVEIVQALQDFDAMDSKGKTMGKIIENILDFSKEHGLLERLVGQQSEDLAKLICEIWKNKSEKTQLSGFTGDAVASLEPMLSALLKKMACDEQENVYDNTKNMISEIVDMVTMDPMDEKTPDVVDVTEKLFKIAEDSQSIRTQWSTMSAGISGDLAPQAQGIEGFLNGFFTQLFRKNGLVARIENQKKLFEDRLEKLEDLEVSAKRKVLLRENLNKKIEKLQDYLKRITEQDRVMVAYQKKQLLVRADDYARVKNNRPGQAEKMLENGNEYAKKHDLEKEFDEYITLAEKKKDRVNEIKKELDTVISKGDLTDIFKTVEGEIDNLSQNWNEKLTEDVDALKIFKADDLNTGLAKSINKIATARHLSKNTLNLMLSDSTVQHELLKAALAGNKGDQSSKEKKEKMVLEMIKKRIQHKDHWMIRWAIKLLCGVWVPDFMSSAKKGKMQAAALAIKIHIAVRPWDTSDSMKILKCLDAIHHDAPDFWNRLTEKHGSDLQKLLDLVLSESHGEYLYEHQQQVQESLKPMLKHMITTLVGEPKTYQSIQCLLSVWVNDDKFNRLYDDIKKRQNNESTVYKAAQKVADWLGQWRMNSMRRKGMLPGESEESPRSTESNKGGSSKH